MDIVYLREPGVMEASKVISFSSNTHKRNVNVRQKCGMCISNTHPTSATPMRMPIANLHFAGVPGYPCHPLSFPG